MWQGKTIHNCMRPITSATCVAFMIILSACGRKDDPTATAIVAANSGLGTQLLQNSLTVEAGTEMSALEAAVSTTIWNPSDKLRADVAQYRGQLGPKAFAITPPTGTGAQAWGSIHGAASTQEAQRDAMDICANVAAQRQINLPCSILFIENQQQPLGW